MAANPTDKETADAGLPLAGVLRHNRFVGRGALLVAVLVAIATPALFATLGYLDLRYAGDDWRNRRPALAAWYGTVAKRPSMTATGPQA